jgi:hypothetical protein
LGKDGRVSDWYLQDSETGNQGLSIGECDGVMSAFFDYTEECPLREELCFGGVD